MSQTNTANVVASVPVGKIGRLPNTASSTADDKLSNQDEKNQEHASKDQSVRFRKLQKRLRRLTGQAIDQYKMIEDGDRILVCLSGGKL